MFIQEIQDVLHSTSPCFSCHLLLHKFCFWSHCIGRWWKYVLSHTVVHMIAWVLFSFLFFTFSFLFSIKSLFPCGCNGTQIWLKIFTSMIDLIFFLTLVISFLFFGGDKRTFHSTSFTWHSKDFGEDGLEFQWRSMQCTICMGQRSRKWCC